VTDHPSTRNGSTRFVASQRKPHSEPKLECLFYSESEAAARLRTHRTTLRALALAGHAPVAPIQLTEHRRLYSRAEVHKLAGLDP
jgi:hypothetical protein